MKGKIPTLIVVAILIVGVVVGVFLVKNRAIFKLGASGEITPKDVRVTNITESSLTVSWTSDKDTSGAISFGKSETLGQTALSEVEGVSTVHSTVLTGLNPETPYFFKINSDGEEFDNNGLAFQAKTGPLIEPAKENIVISGTIEDSEGAPAQNVLVYVSIGGGTQLSTLTSSDGNWVIPISTSRSPDLSSFTNIDSEKTLAEISVQAGKMGVASAQIYPISAKPAPPIILGEVHDFRNLPANKEAIVPGADIQIPEAATGESSLVSPTPSAAAVTLESIDSGEVVATTTPEFFGEGPPETVITIKIESENPITDSVTVDTSGEWKWSPPEGLAPGTHKVTLSWRNAQGILQTLTRSFVVQAADLPAFTATPSATLTPKPTSSPTPTTRLSTTSTPTPKLTATPTPKLTSTPSATPTKKPTSTASSLPDSGIGTQTLTLILFAISLLTFSGFSLFLSFKKERF